MISSFSTLPPNAIGGLLVLLLYAIQSEIRFGSHARTMRTGASDRHSTFLVSISSAVAIVGFVLAVKASSPSFSSWIPPWFRNAVVPGMPLVAWVGVVLGILGVGMRLFAVLKLRERYTRTLLVQSEHTIERGGPYRWVRHPGYLGSLLCLNGIALSSGNLVSLIASLVATSAAYSYRIKVEDEMLVATLGPAYAEYQQQVGALIPFFHFTKL